MQQSQFHSPEELESDRMTDAEAAEVVRLWAENQRAAPPALRSTSIQDVAEGLDIAPERARAILKEVRQSPMTLQEIFRSRARSAEPDLLHRSITIGRRTPGYLDSDGFVVDVDHCDYRPPLGPHRVPSDWACGPSPGAVLCMVNYAGAATGHDDWPAAAPAAGRGAVAAVKRGFTSRY